RDAVEIQPFDDLAVVHQRCDHRREVLLMTRTDVARGSLTAAAADPGCGPALEVHQYLVPAHALRIQVANHAPEIRKTRVLVVHLVERRGIEHVESGYQALRAHPVGRLVNDAKESGGADPRPEVDCRSARSRVPHISVDVRPCAVDHLVTYAPVDDQIAR